MLGGAWRVESALGMSERVAARQGFANWANRSVGELKSAWRGWARLGFSWRGGSGQDLDGFGKARFLTL